ncbi:MAG: DeoR family transcriptional regulator [Chloroflexota bacterium]
MPSSQQREKQILEYLEQEGSVAIQELATRLAVSPMTVHRDLNRLMAAGRVQKTHGGAKLITSPDMETDKCAMCGKTVLERTAFVINQENGKRQRACCPHCGLMLQKKTEGVTFTSDFLHNHMLSASQATYLIQSDLTVCCAPSVLSFGSRQEAEKFQKGFGGYLVDMARAVEFLTTDETRHKMP